jgi:hypothetical protein
LWWNEVVREKVDVLDYKKSKGEGLKQARLKYHKVG